MNVLGSSSTHPAFHDTLVRLARDVDLVDGSPQVVKEEGPVTGSQVHLAGLPGFAGTLLRSLVQQQGGRAFVFKRCILQRERKNAVGHGNDFDLEIKL